MTATKCGASCIYYTEDVGMCELFKFYMPVASKCYLENFDDETEVDKYERISDRFKTLKILSRE